MRGQERVGKGAGYAFSASVDERLKRLHVVWVDHFNKRSVDPASGFDAVEPADDDLKLHVVVLIFVLDRAVVGGNLNAVNALLDESRRDVGFGLANVGFAEEELPVEVRDVDDI